MKRSNEALVSNCVQPLNISLRSFVKLVNEKVVASSTMAIISL